MFAFITNLQCKQPTILALAHCLGIGSSRDIICHSSSFIPSLVVRNVCRRGTKLIVRADTSRGFIVLAAETVFTVNMHSHAVKRTTARRTPVGLTEQCHGHLESIVKTTNWSFSHTSLPHTLPSFSCGIGER